MQTRDTVVHVQPLNMEGICSSLQFFKALFEAQGFVLKCSIYFRLGVGMKL